MNKQRERFESAWREDFGGGIDESVELAVTEGGHYASTTTACEFRAFQRGEASGLELAALPEKFPVELIARLRADPLTANGDDDDMHERIGWLVCAWPQIKALMARGE